MLGFQAALPAQRRPTVPAGDPVVVDTTAGVAIVNPVPIAIRKGDKIDVGLDWSQWVASNGGVIKASAWAKHDDSPQTPTISGAATLFDAAKGHTAVVLDATAATVGDTYYLKNTVTFEGPAGAAFQMPERQLVRTIAVRVSK